MQNEKLIPVQVLPIDFRPRLWYNPDLKSTYFMLPGLIGLVLQFLIPMITATAIVREKERGNIEQLLVTPIKPYELILGKIIPYIVIGIFIAASIITTMHFLIRCAYPWQYHYLVFSDPGLFGRMFRDRFVGLDRRGQSAASLANGHVFCHAFDFTFRFYFSQGIHARMGARYQLFYPHDVFFENRQGHYS